MKLSAGTIGTILFTVAGIAVFTLMAKRPAVEGSALNFGMPLDVKMMTDEKAPATTSADSKASMSKEEEATKESTESTETTTAESMTETTDEKSPEVMSEPEKESKEVAPETPENIEKQSSTTEEAPEAIGVTEVKSEASEVMAKDNQETTTTSETETETATETNVDSVDTSASMYDEAIEAIKKEMPADVLKSLEEAAPAN